MNKLTILFCLLFLITSCSQKENSIIKESKAFQYKMNLEYTDKQKSPLTKEDFVSFSSLDFFKINIDYSVIADFVRTPNEKSFKMLTTTSRVSEEVKYGEAHFTINNKKYKLNIYQNLKSKKTVEHENDLFLPFTDLTNGKESYAGGRYINLSIKDISTENKIIINFNKAYNPYCAYNHKYSCPIPPKENHLTIEIYAGVKKYH